MKANNYHLILKLLFLSFLFSGCQTSGNTQVTSEGQMIHNSPIPSVTIFTPTETSSTKTSVPSVLTASPTISYIQKTSTKEVTNLPQVTLTPLVTLTNDEALKFVLELLKTNAGCRLPCWWGIIPGVSSWQKAENFLASFAVIGTMKIDESSQKASVKILSPEMEGRTEYNYVIRDGIVQDIEIYNWNFAPAYNLANLLKNYGPPDEVWLSAFYQERYLNYFVSIVVFYPQQGILIEYTDGQTDLIGETIQKYPQKAEYPFLYLWSPQNKRNFSEVYKDSSFLNSFPPYIPLEQASGMSIKTFYDLFVQDNPNAHINIPIGIWSNYRQ